MRRTFAPSAFLARYMRAQPSWEDVAGSDGVERCIASELASASVIDRCSPWPTHRIRYFLQSQANRELKSR
jgi:hypothetical protein